jgi:hypothetical protein
VTRFCTTSGCCYCPQASFPVVVFRRRHFRLLLFSADIISGCCCFPQTSFPVVVVVAVVAVFRRRHFRLLLFSAGVS